LYERRGAKTAKEVAKKLVVFADFASLRETRSTVVDLYLMTNYSDEDLTFFALVYRQSS
jgi:hypothetical protein